MKTRTGQKLKLTTVEELLGVPATESSTEIDVDMIHMFKNHPFKVLDDEKMSDLVESIRVNGILSPVLVRPDGEDSYEMISGHRRMHAAKIVGLTMITVAGFLAEVGDVRRFESPRQIQKLAGLSLRENSSGKHKGQTTISKRGWSKLRAVLFNAAIPLIAKNPEFRSLHEYYTTRANNPLKKKQSVIAISCKLIRVFYAILANGVIYDPEKMISDIHRPSQAA